MYVHNRLVSCFFNLILAATLATDASASCPTMTPGPPCQEFRYTDAVFIGVATRVVRVPNTTQLMIGPYISTTVYFSVEEIFKGVEGSAVVLDLDHCGHSFKEGERYLVYAHRNPNDTKKFDVRAGSSRTRLLSEAKEDLEYIRNLSADDRGARIFGTIVQRTLYVKRKTPDADLLQNVKVTLDGNNQQQEVFANSEGKYEFKGLPAGEYRVRADLPASFNYEPQTVKVTDQACVRADITARNKGWITGRVFDVDGRPLVGVVVSLVSADADLQEIVSNDKDKEVWDFSFTDGEGRYGFTSVAPGRYRLVINRSEFEKSQELPLVRPLARIFHPGVYDLAGATVVVVRKNDDKPQDYDFRLLIRQ